MVDMDCGQYYILYSLLNGFLGPGKTTPSRSRIECMVRCQGTDGCSSFFYRDDDKLCQQASTWLFSSDGLTSTPGYKYYMKPADDPCEQDTCNGHGTCAPDTNNPPAAVCSCDAGYIGGNCENDDPCEPDTCNSHGSCTSDTNNPPAAVCSCDAGYNGDNCENGCGIDWTFKSGQCYRYMADRKNHEDAETSCRSYGRYLSIGGTEEDHENMGLMGKVHRNGFWVGGSDEEVEGRWVWSNGQAITLDLWNPEEPNGGTRENCLEIKGADGVWNWNDAPCHALMPYLCEKCNTTRQRVKDYEIY